MKSLGLLFLTLFGVSARSRYTGNTYSRNVNPFRLIRNVNAMNTTWQAGYTEMSHRSVDAKRQYNAPHQTTMKNGVPRYVARNDMDVPDSFDAREQWSECESLRQIRNESGLDSAWALATAAAFSDHHCIATGEETIISGEDVFSCTSLQDECPEEECGPMFAWFYWVKRGFVTESCRPYPQQEQPSKVCVGECTAGSGIEYETDMRSGALVYMLGEVDTESIIKETLIRDGPLTAMLLMFEDFYSYSTGVYQHVQGAMQKYHAVKLIGWGEEAGVPYWLAANSWGVDWGEKGFFKILRGSDECNIERALVMGGVAHGKTGGRHRMFRKGRAGSDRA